MLFGYDESLDYSKLPGFDKLTEEQQKHVHEEFERGYNKAKHMGVKIALGKGHQTAKVALEQFQQTSTKKEQPVPPSIFAGLENCQ